MYKCRRLHQEQSCSLLDTEALGAWPGLAWAVPLCVHTLVSVCVGSCGMCTCVCVSVRVSLGEHASVCVWGVSSLSSQAHPVPEQSFSPK